MDCPQEAAQRLVTDPHAPHTMRVNGPLSNMTEFAEAFGCQSGDSMHRADAERVNIW